MIGRNYIVSLFLIFIILLTTNIISSYNMYIFDINIISLLGILILIITYIVSPLLICFPCNNLLPKYIKSSINYVMIISSIFLTFNSYYHYNFILSAMWFNISIVGINFYLDVIIFSMVNSYRDYNSRFNNIVVINHINPIFNICEDYIINGLNKDCSICMETIKQTDKPTKLKCNHYFHIDCITEWNKEKNTCPNCRTIIN